METKYPILVPIRTNINVYILVVKLKAIQLIQITDWKNQTYSCPRNWRPQHNGNPIEGSLKSFEQYGKCHGIESFKGGPLNGPTLCKNGRASPLH